MVREQEDPVPKEGPLMVRAGLGLMLLFPSAALAGEGAVILATSTSMQDSGLLDQLVPVFERESGYRVHTIAVGSGQAMALGRRGEADVLLVHFPEAEEPFVSEGFGRDRRLVMHNDFIMVGPAGDPAGLKKESTVLHAFKKIATTGVLFVSRGDHSGTHAKEMALWKKAGVPWEGVPWRIETGLGMGQTLTIASEKRGYTLTDRGTYLALKKNLSLGIVQEEDADLFNFYHVILVDPARFPKVNVAGARAFAEFIVSAGAQEAIRTFGLPQYGAPLFYPDAVQGCK
jgi:tungstate transport system substrate-binding protein